MARSGEAEWEVCHIQMQIQRQDQRTKNGTIPLGCSTMASGHIMMAYSRSPRWVSLSRWAYGSW